MKKLVALLLCMMLLCSTAYAVSPGFAVRNGSREEKKICITVDDCMDIPILQEIFEMTQELEIPITIFTLGSVVKEEDKELWQTIALSDCEIGNHCYGHDSLTKKKNASGIRRTLERTQIALDAVLGYHYPMRMMRPPFGRISDANVSRKTVLGAIESAGYAKAVLWDVSETDAEKCLPKVQNGSILLFHTIEKDLECLEKLLPQLKEQGYEFVTVSEMFGYPPIELPPEATAAQE